MYAHRYIYTTFQGPAILSYPYMEGRDITLDTNVQVGYIAGFPLDTRPTFAGNSGTDMLSAPV